jgi:hypothetical protein
MAAKPSTTTVLIPELRLRTREVLVLGDSPLIVHAWSQKAKMAMLGKQMKEAKGSKEAKDPIADFNSSLYRLPDGGYGFPSVGFKASAITAVTSIDGMTKVAARQSFHIVGEQIEIESAFKKDGVPLKARYDLVRILGNEPEMREDMVRVGMGTADIRYRGQFWPWRARLRVTFNEGVLSEAQILNLLNTAGFGVGVGEWRPERDGQYGRFRVADQAEAEEIEAEEVALARAA